MRSALYQPRLPHDSIVAQLLDSHLDAFIESRSHRREHGLPVFVVKQLRAAQHCGDLTRGFIRMECDRCRAPRIVAFSCKGRVCTSCSARRMADRASFWVDRRLPTVAYHQWVVTYPYDLRRVMAYDAPLASRVFRLTIEVLHRWQREQFARLARPVRASKKDALTAALVVVQRQQDNLGLNVHIHALLPAGVWWQEPASAVPRFTPVAPPRGAAIRDLVHRLEERIVGWLQRRAARADAGDELLDGDRIGQLNELLALASAAPNRTETAHDPGDRCPSENRKPKPDRLVTAANSPRGFGLHVGRGVPAGDRRRLQRVLEYFLRPPVCEQRMSWTPEGNLRVQLKRRWKNGTTAVEYAPLAAIARLAALIPPPRFQLLREYGQFAPTARLHKALRPPLPEPETINGAEPSPETPKRNSWANLLMRVFAVDATKCPNCETGRLHFIAVIKQPTVVHAFIAALLATQQLHPSRLHPTRAPPNLLRPPRTRPSLEQAPPLARGALAS